MRFHVYILAVILLFPLASKGQSCSEKPLNYGELEKIAKDPSIKNQTDFLNAIKDTMTTFTFVYASKSAQGSNVSDELPGVIRMSQDGKLIIRYTCDSEAPNVEVMSFDDKTNKFNLASFDFKSNERVAKNPVSCMNCHNPNGTKGQFDPRPNWQQYDIWDGFYGGDDDTLASSHSNENSETKYKKFRISQKINPCYSTLPWPKDTKIKDYAIYPYASETKSTDVSRRPNLKFTSNLCRLNAKRLARRFKERPEYKYLKFSLAMKTLQCPQFSSKDIVSIVPEYKESSVFNLNPIGNFLGIKNSEWTIKTNETENREFNCGIVEDDGFTLLSMDDLLEGELNRSLASDVPELKPLLVQGKPFGYEEKGCYSVNSGSATFTKNSKTCEILAAEQNKINSAIKIDETFDLQKQEMKKQREIDCAPVSNVSELVDVAQVIINSQHIPDKSNGKTIVANICASCHNNDMLPDKDYFSSEASMKDAFKKYPKLKDEIEKRIHSELDPMPPGKLLKPTDRLDVLEYLKEFQTK